jgi:uncharacterized membrane protein YccC
MQTFQTTAVLTLAVLLPGCGSELTMAQLQEDSRDVLTEVVDVFEAIGDSHTAEAARGRLDELTNQLVALRDQAAQRSTELLESPEVVAAMARAREALDELNRRIDKVASDPELRAHLQAAMDRLREQLGD